MSYSYDKRRKYLKRLRKNPEEYAKYQAIEQMLKVGDDMIEAYTQTSLYGGAVLDIKDKQ